MAPALPVVPVPRRRLSSTLTLFRSNVFRRSKTLLRIRGQKRGSASCSASTANSESESESTLSISTPDGDTPSLTLDKLPYDVLLEVLAFLQLPEIKAVQLVCHALNEAAESPEIWHGLAYDLQMRSRALILDDYTCPSTLRLPALKNTVLRTSALERNWEQRPSTSNVVIPQDRTAESEHNDDDREREPNPRCITPPAAIELESVKITDFLSCASILVTDEFIIMPSKNQMVCLDLKIRFIVSAYALKLHRALTSLHLHTVSKTAYAVVVGSHWETREMQLHVVHIDLPPPGETKGRYVEFKRKACFKLPGSFAVVTLSADADRRMVCLLVQPYPLPQTLKVFVIFDWDTNIRCAIDVGFPLEIPMGLKTSQFRFSDDLNEMVMLQEQDGLWIQRHWSIAELRADAARRPSAATAAFAIMPAPYEQHSFKLDPPAAPSGHPLRRCVSWTLSQTWLKYKGVPARYSHVFVYGTPVGDGKVLYQVTQHYTAESGPYRNARFVFTLNDPVLINYDEHLKLPLMSVTFNHFVWIEPVAVPANEGEGEDADADAPPPPMTTKRVMRFITFPDPYDPEDSQPVRTMTDIPSNVLEKAYHIFLEPSLGAILITTTDNKLHRYQYA